MSTWKELVADKRARQKALIPKDWLITAPPATQLNVIPVPEKCSLLSAREIEITNTTDVAILLRKLANAEWSSVEVTTAFYKRAIIAHQLVNCLTEIFVERALARAAELDARLKSTGKVAGPLHGLPISLKDQLRIKGQETTMGYASRIGIYADRDAALVEILYECGAVPFVQTNVPQTLMWPETFNHVYGRTVNPHNRSLTSGGSSGGEGALIALKGSPLGVGSDIGGSVRIPSALCGLYGLRPSTGRVPYGGAVNSLEGQESVPSVLGPISNSLNGVKIFMQAVIASKPWLKDPLAVRKPWDEDAYALAEHGGGKGLCIGILWNDGEVIPHPPVIRALLMTRAALRAAGHKVVDWEPYKHAEILKVTGAIFEAGAVDDYAAVTAATGEPILTTMNLAEGEVVQTEFRPSDVKVSVYQLWQLHKERARLRQEHLDKWQQTAHTTGTGRPVDAIIAPCAAYAAPPHGMNRSAQYTMVWNGLDYTACAFPVTKVDQVLDAKQPVRSTFLSPKDEQNYKQYAVATYENAPIGLQLVGRTHEEEAVIAMTEIVDEALKSYKLKERIMNTL